VKDKCFQSKYLILLIGVLLAGAGIASAATTKSDDLSLNSLPRNQERSTKSHEAARKEPSKEEVLEAMKRATQFMVDKVAYRGGYVWAVSEDFSHRYGEVPARATQVWVQSGTPDVGMTLLDAYDVTHDSVYLGGARKAADALIYGQHPLGGWNYVIDFDSDPTGLKTWYEREASRFKWGMEEYRHYYGNATFDDGNTSSATRFLLRFYLTTHDSRYRGPLLKALKFILLAQYPNGAWPQRYPLSHEFTHDGFPDYTSYYTLNDGSAAGNIEVLVEASEKLGDQRYLKAAKRAVEFLITIQGPRGQAGWAEQYDPKTMRPVKARTHEPAGFVIRESEQVIELLEKFSLMTGERRYLKPIPGCLDWFDRVNRESVEFKRPPARYYEFGTNLPIYNLRTDKTNAEGYGLYRWSNTDAQGDGEGLYRFGSGQSENRPVVDVLPIRKRYEWIVGLSREQARVEYQKRSGGGDRPEQTNRRQFGNTSVADVIAAMDNRGGWVRDDVRVLKVSPNSQGINPGTFETIRGYSTATFVRNLTRLIASAKVAHD
jgi:PelA/Pel-15E family pectate lyase